VKLVVIKQKSVEPLGKLVRRMGYLEDIVVIPFEAGDPSGIYLIPKTSDVDCWHLNIARAIAQMRMMIAAFKESRARMSASAFTAILEDMQDDLRVLEQFGKEELDGQEEKEERVCG
jgi:hypothetical protein